VVGIRDHCSTVVAVVTVVELFKCCCTVGSIKQQWTDMPDTPREALLQSIRTLHKFPTWGKNQKPAAMYSRYAVIMRLPWP
jgi:hypothetical protein